MYTTTNFKTKKALKEAVKARQDFIPVTAGDNSRPPAVTYFQPGPFGGNEPKDGTVCIEGPHFPKPHRWYAECKVKDGEIVSVK